MIVRTTIITTGHYDPCFQQLALVRNGLTLVTLKSDFRNLRLRSLMAQTF